MIIQRSSDPLSKEVWMFTYLSGHIYLDEYQVLRRETKRHKFMVVGLYQRLRTHRHERIPPKSIAVEDVPLPDDVKAGALDQFIRTIKVLKWDGGQS